MPKAPSPKNESSAYKHLQESVQRPDVGVEAQFPNKKPPKTYRYDSSLAPELCWDESGERPFAEWLLILVSEAAEKGESVVFAKPQTWEETQEQFTTLSQCAARLKSLTKPFLNWAGKAERQQISVPTLPLFVHERHSTHAILETLKSHRDSSVQQTLDLFGDPQLDIADKLDAYQHKGPWTNRLVLGDSLQVMNSLLEYEGMGGQVQMIYFDPPYGVSFGSNFQPFVRRNKVRHGQDDEMIREPEMVKAYRDTWDLGLHSYLTYIRDRLLLSRELLTESGSVFVQISDQNLHHVREILDELFGESNFISLITFKKTAGLGTDGIASVSDYILWYAKNGNLKKANVLYQTQNFQDDPNYVWIMSQDGEKRRISKDEKLTGVFPAGWRLFRHQIFLAAGLTPSCVYPIELDGDTFYPTASRSWSTNPEGTTELKRKGRIVKNGNTVNYVRYADDFPLNPLNNFWSDGASGVGMRSFNVEVQWWSRRIVHLGGGLKAMSLPRPSIEIRCDLITSFLGQ